MRDELAVATNELTMLTENLKASKIQQDESSGRYKNILRLVLKIGFFSFYFLENITRVMAENENLRDEIREIMEQKHNFESEMEEFTEAVNLRVDEWKKILEEKEKEITDLRSRQMQSSHHSSLSSLPQDNEQSQVFLLNKILNEREKQLLELKTQLQDAVKEMEKTTAVIQKLKEEKNKDDRKLLELSESLQEVKKQLKGAHKRTQDLQEDLTHTEKLLENKDNDVRILPFFVLIFRFVFQIKEILDKLKNKGHSDLSEYLTQIQHLKRQNRTHEKQIMTLVKTTNKLQDACDRYENENEALR